MRRLGDVCSVDGCVNTKLNARGLCRKHYARLLRHGDTETVHRPHRLALTDFGWWMAGKLAARDMSWAGLAQRCGVAPRTVGYWRSGRNYPNVLQVAALADALDVPVSDLVDAIVEDARERGVRNEERNR